LGKELDAGQHAETKGKKKRALLRLRKNKTRQGGHALRRLRTHDSRISMVGKGPEGGDGANKASNRK